MSGTDGRDPYEDYMLLNRELKLYKEILANREQIIVANKMDMPSSSGNLHRFKAKVKKKIYEISALKGVGLKELIKAIYSKIKKIKHTKSSFFYPV